MKKEGGLGIAQGSRARERFLVLGSKEQEYLLRWPVSFSLWKFGNTLKGNGALNNVSD